MQRQRKKRIIAFLNAFIDGKSGSDTCLIEVLKRITNADIVVVTSYLGMRLCEEEGVKAQFVVSSWEKRFSLLLLRYICRTIKIIFWKGMQRKNAVFFTSSDFFPDVFPSFLWKRKDSRWIQIIHHLYPNYSGRPGSFLVNVAGYYLQRISLYFIQRRADRIIVVNTFLKEQLLSLGFGRDKIVVIPNGIDTRYLQSIHKQENYFDGVYFGRLHRAKGIFDLLAIWQKVLRTHRKARLALIGYGGKEIVKSLNRAIRKHHLAKTVHVLGFLPKERAYSLLKSSSVGLFPSHEEGFGIAIAEALSCSVPVVAWDLPVYKEVFNGYIISVDRGNISGFAEAVSTVLTNKNQHRGQKVQARMFVEKYSWDRIFPRYKSVLGL